MAETTMGRRARTARGRNTRTLGLAVSALLALASPLAAQTQGASDRAWVIPRTPSGRPDFQWNWTNATLTPIVRRQGQGPVLSPEEVLQIEGREASRMAADAAPVDPDRPPLRAGGSIGSYNAVYHNRGGRVAVVDGEARSSLITEPASGRQPPLSAEGERRVSAYRAFMGSFGEADNPENRPLVERCIMSRSNAGPPMLPDAVYNNNYTIVQTDDHVVIMAEMINDARVIALRQPSQEPQNVRPWMGLSWGRWEGDTLVIETTNVHPSQTILDVPPSEGLRLVERLAWVGEGRLLYEFAIDDPTTYTQPWGGQIPFERFDALLYEYACHEANYALSGILSGARYEERTGR
jgi:hypothetical protein